MGRQTLKRINEARKNEAELRRAKIQKLVAEGKTNAEIGEVLGVASSTVAHNLAVIRKQPNTIAESVTVEADGVLRGLAEFAMQSETMTDSEIVSAVRACWQDLTKLHGSNAPNKSIVGHVSGPQLDALYLNIRQELIDLSDGEKQEALLLMREFAKSRKKPVVVDAMPLQPVERRLTDGDIS